MGETNKYSREKSVQSLIETIKINFEKITDEYVNKYVIPNNQ